MPYVITLICLTITPISLWAAIADGPTWIGYTVAAIIGAISGFILLSLVCANAMRDARLYPQDPAMGQCHG